MSTPAELQAATLKNYMNNFSRQVDVYKESIENTRTNMINNLKGEIDRLGIPSPEPPKPFIIPKDKNPADKITLSISSSELYKTLYDINALLIKLFNSIPDMDTDN